MKTPRKAVWLLGLPLLGWLLLFVVAPTVLLVVISFCERDFIGRVVYHFTWANYLRAFDPVYLAHPPALGRLRRVDDRRLPARGLPAGVFHRARPATRARFHLLLLVMIPFWTSFLIRTYAWIHHPRATTACSTACSSPRACSPHRPTCSTRPARSCSG